MKRIMKKWDGAVALVAPVPGGDGGYGGNSGKGGNSKGKSKGKAGAPRGSYKWIWQLVRKNFHLDWMLVFFSSIKSSASTKDLSVC